MLGEDKLKPRSSCTIKTIRTYIKILDLAPKREGDSKKFETWLQGKWHAEYPLSEVYEKVKVLIELI